jgi:hypothetical protein
MRKSPEAFFQKAQAEATDADTKNGAVRLRPKSSTGFLADSKKTRLLCS